MRKLVPFLWDKKFQDEPTGTEFKFVLQILKQLVQSDE